MKTLNLTSEQVETILSSLVVNYYRMIDISKKGNEADAETWEAIAENILNISEIIENQSNIKTFRNSSFKSQI